MLVVGDSIGLDLGQPLVADLAATGVVTATLDGRVDTGLSRPDYFNWPAELRVDLANDQPAAGGGDDGGQRPPVAGGRRQQHPPTGTPAWNAAYGQRVGAFIDEANAAGAHVLWVGMPPMAAPQLNARDAGDQRLVRPRSTPGPRQATYLASSTVLGRRPGELHRLPARTPRAPR